MSAASKLIRMVTRKKSKPKRKYRKKPTDRVRQDEGNTASDLMTPATAATPDSSGTKKLVGTGEPTSGNIPRSKVNAKRQNDLGRELTRSMKKLESLLKFKKTKEYKNKRDSFKGKDKIKFIANKLQEVELLKSKIKNMKDDRDIVPKKKGGIIVKKKMGGGKIKNKKTVKPKSKSKSKVINVSPGKPYYSSKELGEGYEERLPSAVYSEGLRKRSPFGKASPKATGLDVVAEFENLSRGKEGKTGSRLAKKTAKELVKKNAGGKVKGYKKGGSITYRMTGGQVVGHGYD